MKSIGGGECYYWAAPEVAIGDGASLPSAYPYSKMLFLYRHPDYWLAFFVSSASLRRVLFFLAEPGRQPNDFGIGFYSKLVSGMVRNVKH